MSEFKLKSDLLLQKVDDEMVLLEPESGDYFTLNAVGADMLELVQNGKSVDDIAKHISDIYTVTAEEAKQDLLALLVQLEQQHLAERV